MQPTSKRFQQALKRSHVQKTRLDLYIEDELIMSDIAVSDGNIVNDDGDYRTTGDFTLHDDALHPTTHNRTLYPGTELRPYRGIAFPDGTEELLPMGVLGITQVRNDDSGDGYNLRVDCKDRANRVSKAKFKKDKVIPAGGQPVEVIQSIISQQVPWVQFDSSVPYSSMATRQIKIEQGDDPWALCRKLADAAALELYFDRVGICRLDTPNVHGMQLLAGENLVFRDGVDAEIMYTTYGINDEGSFSRVGVTVETTDNVDLIYVEAIDDDPASSTYIHGPFGDVPYYIVTSEITTESDARKLAEKELANRRGVKLQVQLLNAPIPSIDIFDYIGYVRDKYGVSQLYQNTKMTTPMVAIRGQNLSMREQPN